MQRMTKVLSIGLTGRVTWHCCEKSCIEALYYMQDELARHCVTKWVFVANLIIDPELLLRHYHIAWQSLPSTLSLPADE